MATKPKKGMPLFDKETLDQIVKEAVAGSKTEVAKKYGVPAAYIYRWVGKARQRSNGSITPTDAPPAVRKAPQDSPRMNGPYRLAQGQEEENRRLKELLAELLMENRELQRLVKKI